MRNPILLTRVVPLALLAGLVLPVWTSFAHGQTTATSVPAAKATNAAPAAPATYRSALEAYQPFTDEKIVNWKEANDQVSRIGGWRAYAKQAQQPQPSQTPDVAAKPAPPARPAKP